jgi:glycosyltransferase involved in cell wall biosynthesis
MPKKIILSVTNDLVSDQRVNKVCNSLLTWGYSVTLVGRLKKDSPAMASRKYEVKRMRLLFDKGFLFYAEYNIRLFFLLLFCKADSLIANDLDTLPANYLSSKIKNQQLIYDSHEYFTQVPELVSRKRVQAFWKKIEQIIFPKLKYVYTVNESIATIYFSEYGVKPAVVRNFPVWVDSAPALKSKKELNLPLEKKIILYQGAVNIDRGLPEAIDAMQYIAHAVLVIIGEGDSLNALNERVANSTVGDKVLFLNRIPLEQLKYYTLHADIGISLEKESNDNYRYALPNKIFDYIHAGVPVLASPLIELKKIFSQYEMGLMIENHSPQHIAAKINFMLGNESEQAKWKKNCLAAAKEFCWQKEENVLNNLVQ